MRASYRHGIDWIAYNDDGAETDPDVIGSYMTTIMLADLFGKDPEVVAKAVAKKRKTINQGGSDA